MTIEAVLIDQREPDWIKALTFGGVPVTTALLDYGDMHVATSDGTLVVIERKTPADLLGTLRDERLFPQVQGLVKLSRWAYVLITGEIRCDTNGNAYTDRQTGWNWNAVQGALLSISEMGAMVTYCAGDADVEAAVTRLANRTHERLLIAPARPAGMMDMGMTVLTSLQGVGPDRAEKMLEYCGSAGQALSALTWQEQSIPGVPRNIKQLARLALGLKPNEILAVNTTDGVTK